jgi:hypothetical protein
MIDPHMYEVLAVVLTAGVLGVLWKVADFISVATRWIEHDLKMRRGNRE